MISDLRFKSGMLVLALGCGGPKGEGVADDTALPTCTQCNITNDESYTYGAALFADVLPVAAATDVRVSWAGLQQDIHGHVRGTDFDIEDALLIAFRDLSPVEVLDLLATDRLTQAQVALYATCTPTDDACKLSDFNVFGRTFELETYFTQGSGTWLIVMQSSTEAGGHAFVFLDPQNQSTAAQADVVDETSRIEVDVDLAGLPRLRPVADPSTTISWEAVSRDGLSNPLATHQLDRLILARYPGLSASDLEDRVFDLERIADPLWVADVAGRSSITLGELDPEGAWPGADAEGPSLLGVYCSLCLNPAPKIVAMLASP